MKLWLTLLFVASTSATSPNIGFGQPRYNVSSPEIPNIFPRNQEIVQKYPLAIDAVLSVALKLQAIDDHGGKQQNFLVSPLAVAGALCQLLLGAKGELQKQIADLVTLGDETDNGIDNTSAVPVQPQVNDNSGFDASSSTKGSSIVFNRFGTISAQNAEAYQTHSLAMPQYAAKGRDGLPGLELHRQLGSLIYDLSTPLPASGAVHPLANSSYLHSSSAFFLDKRMELKENYARAIKDFYHSSFVPVDFSNNPAKAQQTVNNWGSLETGGLIRNFLSYPPPRDTAVIQAVAVHFRGAWQTPFIPQGTSPGVFQTSATTEVPVTYMRGSFDEAFYSENATLGIRLLALPYAKFDCAMYVVLPMDTNRLKFNVGHLVSELTSKQLADLVGQARQRSVNVVFPKLSLTGSLSLVAALEKHAAYLNKQKADAAANNATDHTSQFPTRRASWPSTTAEQPARQVPVTNANFESDPRIARQGSAVDPLAVIPLATQRPTASQASTQVRENSGENRILVSSRNSPDLPSLGVNRGSVSQDIPEQPSLILTEAAENSQFRISNVIQQIALEVNEAGTEAAAIAGSTINYSGDVKNFKVNRPFLFFIRHEKTNAILFWGTIVDPTA